MSTSLPAFAHGLVDDAAIFPPGNLPLDEAVRANRTWWQRTPHAALVGSFVVDDRRLPDLGRVVRAACADAVPGLDDPLRVNVVVGGGAGAVEPAVTWTASAGLELAGIEIKVRDSAMGELTHNARRIVTAVEQALATCENVYGILLVEAGVPVYVELPRLHGFAPTPDWLGALDELAASDLRLKLRTGGEEADAFPTMTELATCIGAALDREMPFKCTAGLHHAVRHRDPVSGFEHHGFLNVLLATRASLDGATTDEVGVVLERTDSDALTDGLDPDALARARRWFRSFGSCSVRDPLDDLSALGLLEKP